METPESFYICPLPKCEWSTPFEWPQNPEVEHVLRDHFESHDIIEWVKAITSFKPIDQDWVWCGHEDHEGPTNSTFCVNADTLVNDYHACPGPHHELFIKDVVDQEEEKEKVNG